MTEYPKRDAYFSHRFVRLLTKTAMAQVIGPKACWLLTVVVHQEDSKRYTGPVNYWNYQLESVGGFGSRGSLVRAREKAVGAGWLHYEPGGKGKCGKYWVIIPERFEDLPDLPSDENPSEYPSVLEQENGRETVCPSKLEHDNGQENDLSVHERTANGLQTDCKRTANGHHPTLTLNPNPKEESARATRKFVKPTLDEVSAYCSERKNSIDAEHFIDHYESNGWKVGKNAMKNWKAAVRNWEKNGVAGKGKADSCKRSAIDAWAIAFKLAKYQSQFAKDDPDNWNRARGNCPEDVLHFAEDFGLKSILDGKIEIVRGQFTKLWNDSSRASRNRKNNS